ncbi:LysR family transcriptional regulator [Saccharothrix sp. ALI-22-I]|uniref:LysR family transcriptional regulator n=1 Tax=Saccharothrix sp. ALI-22-I TaxID=1933778 RepID=UPI00097BD28E|nr:LysR family transcriptional regulator [Saccharothrix sp. ALI-22-I]ONI92110.1 LysR family transcriptional regulator [Saccharothrix sp. ALI-22-I]
MFTLRQLESLTAIVDEGSFTAAADVLGVTQPALSHQIRPLERAIGLQVLERLPRSVRLTTAGRAFLPHARAALGAVDRGSRAARQAVQLEAAELGVATIYSISLGVLPPVLRAWRQQHGSTQVRLFEHRHADNLRNAMLAGQADLAIGPVPVDWSGQIVPLGEEEFVVVLPFDDPDVGPEDTTVDLALLAHRSWVHFAPDNGLAALLDEVCARAGFQPRVAVRAEQTAAAPILASVGLGPTLIPLNVIPPNFDGRLLRPDPPVRRTMSVYTRHGDEPVVSAFISTLIRTVELIPNHLRAVLKF